MYNVRYLHENDFEAIYEMGKRFVDKHVHLKNIGWDRGSIGNLFSLCLSADKIVFLVLECNDRPVGMMGVIITPHMFNNSLLTAEEFVWWIDYEHRGKIGMTFLKTMEEHLKEKGVEKVYFKFLEEEVFHPRVMERMYRRNGYTKIETTMGKEL